jgi:hypothetical protein
MGGLGDKLPECFIVIWSLIVAYRHPPNITGQLAPLNGLCIFWGLLANLVERC